MRFRLRVRNLLDDFARQHRSLGQQALVGALVVQVSLDFFTFQQMLKALIALVGKDSDFVARFFSSRSICEASISFGALVFFLSLAGEDLHVDDRAFDARRASQRSVTHVAGFFAEDRAQQLLFRSELGFALGVTLPTIMSPCFTVAPMRMTPLSSRSRSEDSLTFGMSRVISSGPSFVSRASISNSSMWIGGVVIVFDELL